MTPQFSQHLLYSRWRRWYSSDTHAHTPHIFSLSSSAALLCFSVTSISLSPPSVCAHVFIFVLVFAYPPQREKMRSHLRGDYLLTRAHHHLLLWIHITWFDFDNENMQSSSRDLSQASRVGPVPSRSALPLRTDRLQQEITTYQGAMKKYFGFS